ncbi:putative CoA-transferase [Mycolicibacterium chitae]|uniref:Acyl-CoA transferase/dehydratase n=1 Tax=Mycolicibacterium chitae TaxID=1792 RepID=A0A3S4VJT3_MYCCI|nr:CoA transferase [Mycolicibacterium chitae]MCV7105081.1 CoA transferase [Mycolicibacterium chitae]BBZ05638.1 putative CoA-transferase [Mycolicibacterium chitae]VEG49250.1 acyl-CoA transferase/dehydratase [Mycolicibacterium chitae]
MRAELPLDGLRILDLSHGVAQSCGRYLADLGAEVVRVEPPGGDPARRSRGAVSVPWALRNANKLGITVDLDAVEGQERLRDLVRSADVVLESFSPAEAVERGLAPDDLLAVNPTLVVTSITPFGRTGPYRDWSATEPVLTAMGGVLCRSGLPGRQPVLPPAGIVEQTVAVHAAWATLVAYVKRLRTGVGETVDVAAFEAVVHGFDPGFGAQGSAAAGRAESFPRDRPEAASFYPFFPCADGHVRICLLAKRQWRAMFEWLGEPTEFADPRYDTVAARFQAADRLHPLIAALFADKTRDELVAEGSARAIPVSGVLTVDEVLETPHFLETGSLIDAELADGLHTRVPSGYVSVGGMRAGLRNRAPNVGEHNDTLPDRSRAAGEDQHRSAGATMFPPDPERTGPLAGMRVLDLGVIVVGAEFGRLFADQGADVIKVENTTFPDGLRQTRSGSGINPSFAWGHRNKRSLGLDLRRPEGARLFRQLVAHADVVAANFKPGTLEALGLSFDDLTEINPRIIVSDSSAFGARGRWSTRMGYGPLVRSSCGVSVLWRDSQLTEEDPSAYCDGSTVYPDHIAGHVSAIAVLAAVIGRERTGRGTLVETAQADIAIVHLGPTLTAAAQGAEAPQEGVYGVFPCAGDDEWCVVDARDPAHVDRLAQVFGEPDLPRASSGAVVDAVRSWTARRTSADAAAMLQQAGIPAGPMLRLPEQLMDPHLMARNSFQTMAHPHLKQPVPTNARIAHFSTIPDPQLNPAPLAGEHTREICATLLDLTSEELERLVADNVLQPPVIDPVTIESVPMPPRRPAQTPR